MCENYNSCARGPIQFQWRRAEAEAAELGGQGKANHFTKIIPPLLPDRSKVSVEAPVDWWEYFTEFNTTAALIDDDSFAESRTGRSRD